MAIDADLEHEFPWPSTARSLSGQGSDWRQTASLGWSRGDPYTRIRGFRLNAELIAAYVAQSGREQDGLIYPFVYAWRQHIELALKDLIVQYERIRGLTGEPPFGHDLNRLWSRCRNSFEARGHTGDGELENVGLAIAELHQMDPYGDAFQYPLSRQGFPTLDGIDSLSFERINDALIPVSNFLETADMAISAELEAKLELEREYADARY